MKKTLTLVFAALVAVLLVGCAGGGGNADGGSADIPAGITVEQNGGNVHVSFGGETGGSEEFTVTLADGDGFVTASRLDAGTVEVGVTKDGEEMFTDSEYEGYGVGEFGSVPAGDYVVTVTADGATGEIYFLGTPEGQLDFENMDTEGLFDVAVGLFNA